MYYKPVSEIPCTDLHLLSGTESFNCTHVLMTLSPQQVQFSLTKLLGVLRSTVTKQIAFNQ